MHFWAMVEQSDSALQGKWMKWSNILGPKDDNTLQGSIPQPQPSHPPGRRTRIFPG